jgi:hypothetical protein
MSNVPSTQKSQPQPIVEPKKKKKWGKWIFIGCGTLIFLLIITVAGCLYLGKKLISEKTETESQGSLSDPQVRKDFSDQLDLTMMLENDFGLEEVIISQDGEDLLVRCSAPTIKGEALNNGLVYIFAVINEKAKEEIKTIRLIFTINHVDATIVEVQREAISGWMDNKITNLEFINKFKVISLIK